MTLRLPHSPITADLFRQLPEGPPYYELIKGNLLLWPDEDGPLVTPDRPVTAEFYKRMPEGPPYYQLIKGNLVMSPSPNFFHQTILTSLLVRIGTYLENNPIGVVIASPSDVFLNGTNVYQPDLYYVSNERRNLIVEGGVEGAPDLVVEILSPRTERRDRNEKREAYVRAGVKEMWLVDLESKHVEIHPLAQGVDAPPRIILEPQKLTSALFPGLEIDLNRLFQPIN